MVDLGSRINVIGADTDREFRQKAAAHGHHVWYRERPTLNVNGVGKGSAQCHQIGTYPVAVDFTGDGPSMHQFEANVATGSGSHLPAIYGCASMQEQGADLIL